MRDFKEMWEEIGLNVELHNQLIENMTNLHTKMYLSQKNRPKSIVRFDHSFHSSHKERVAEVIEYRKSGKKSIGTFCIYVPEEIALAADVLPIPLCGGTGWSVNFADKVLPRDICPLIRSTFGMAFSNTCPYKTLKDLAVGETTCDAKKKTWDLFGFYVMEVPQMKNPIDRELWFEEVFKFKEAMEGLSGVKITPEKLCETIKLVNRRRKILQRINEFRKSPNSPISGIDALLISQVALNQDIHKFIENAEALVDELKKRAESGISAYSNSGKRVMIAGSPSPMGNAKIHWIVESSGLQIVADESCTGMRYYRDLVDENQNDIEGMINAIADRYFAIDCACFSPNTERMKNITQVVKDYNVEGVIQNILQFCHGYNVEAKVVEKTLKGIGIPSIKIESDYSEEDIGQIQIRIEAFSELLMSA